MSKYRVRQSELTPYAPANHTGTRNFRLIGPGEACFFPSDEMHVFIVTSEKARVPVIYSPPYLEKNARTLASS